MTVNVVEFPEQIVSLLTEIIGVGFTVTVAFAIAGVQPPNE